MTRDYPFNHELKVEGRQTCPSTTAAAGSSPSKEEAVTLLQSIPPPSGTKPGAINITWWFSKDDSDHNHCCPSCCLHLLAQCQGLWASLGQQCSDAGRGNHGYFVKAIVYWCRLKHKPLSRVFVLLHQLIPFDNCIVVSANLTSLSGSALAGAITEIWLQDPSFSWGLTVDNNGQWNSHHIITIDESTGS